jgi:type VI protein secretion system component VasF
MVYTYILSAAAAVFITATTYMFHRICLNKQRNITLMELCLLWFMLNY